MARPIAGSRPPHPSAHTDRAASPSREPRRSGRLGSVAAAALAAALAGCASAGEPDPEPEVDPREPIGGPTDLRTTSEKQATARLSNFFRRPGGRKVPVFDGAIERHRGRYMLTGTGSRGGVYFSRDLRRWTGPTELLSPQGEGPAWVDGPNSPRGAGVYYRYGASDMVFYNGALFWLFNGMGLAHGQPESLRFEHSTSSRRFDGGIDPQLFVAHNGKLFYLRKVNSFEPHPNDPGRSRPGATGEAWGWELPDDPFWSLAERRRAGIDAFQIVTGQPGRWDNIDLKNFEGPELFYRQGSYYLLFNGNGMFPRTGLYEIGVAQDDFVRAIDNGDKYPGKLIARNLERMLHDYEVLLATSEHGAQRYRFRTSPPPSGWRAPGFDDAGWSETEGGFGAPGRHLNNRVQIPSVYSDAWGPEAGPKTIWARRSVHIGEVPRRAALRVRIEGWGEVFVNGEPVAHFGGKLRAYRMIEVPSDLLRAGENVVAARVSRHPPNRQGDLRYHHLDFGLYDTRGRAVEPDIVGPGQPNVIRGPNGFEVWAVYKALIDGDNGQSKDRVYFYGDEMVVDGPTTRKTPGMRLDAALPSFFDPVNAPDSLSRYTRHELVSFEQGSLRFDAPDAFPVALIENVRGAHYALEADIRFHPDHHGAGRKAGFVAWKQDARNQVRVLLDRESLELHVVATLEGERNVRRIALPERFAFGVDDPRTRSFGEQFHTLRITKNAGRIRAELDHFRLNGDRPIFADPRIRGPGQVGLLAARTDCRFDNVMFTHGFDERGTRITGWGGPWQVSERGITSPAAGERLTFKGVPLATYEVSADTRVDQLPDSGRVGLVPVHVDRDRFVVAAVDFATRKLEVFVQNGDGRRPLASRSLARETVYGHDNFEGRAQRVYEYQLRGPSLVEGVEPLWFYGAYRYLDMFFRLPNMDGVLVSARGPGGAFEPVGHEAGAPRRGVPQHVRFPEPVETDRLRLEVPADINRPFSFAVRERISAHNFLRAVRIEGKLYLYVNGEQKAVVDDPFAGEPARVGLYSSGVSATFDSITSFER